MEMPVTPMRLGPAEGPIVAPDRAALTSPAAAPAPSDLRAATTPTHDAAAEPWPEPDLSLLDEPRPEVPPFPIAVLPRPWRPWVEHAARGAGAAVDHVALSLLTTAASLIGVDRRIAPAPSWSEPCILWTALVGPASSGRTPAVETSLRLVRALQAGLDEAHAEAVRQYEADLPARQAEWNAYCAQTLTAGGLPRPLAALHPPPVGPRRLTAIADDAASMAETLPYAAGSVLLLRDDRAAWFHDMVRTARGEGAGSLWLQAWAGGACRVAHNGKAVASLDCAAVSILGTLRPGQLAEALGDALAAGDEGVAARFLFAWPQRPPFQALRAMPALPGLDAAAALARLRDIEGEDRALPLAGDALAAFDRFRQAHHEEALRHDDPPAAWWGKGPGTVLRLAGVLTFLDWAARADGTPETPTPSRNANFKGTQMLRSPPTGLRWHQETRRVGGPFAIYMSKLL